MMLQCAIRWDTVRNDGFDASGRSIWLTATILVHGDAAVVQRPKAGNIGERAQAVHYGWGTAVAYHLYPPPQQYPLKHQQMVYLAVVCVARLWSLPLPLFQKNINRATAVQTLRTPCMDTPTPVGFAGGLGLSQ